MMSAPAALGGRVRTAAAETAKKPLSGIGQWTLFIGQVFFYLPLTVRRYSRQTLAATINMAWGQRVVGR